MSSRVFFRLLSLTALCLALNSCNDAKILTDCENILTQNLKSPSSYKRIDMFLTKRDVAKSEISIEMQEEKLPIEEMNKRLNEYDKFKVKPAKYDVVIVYDAQNAFGATLRGRFTCNYRAPAEHGPDGPFKMINYGFTN